MTTAPKALGTPWATPVHHPWKLRRLKDVACVVNGYPFDSKGFDAAGEHALVRIRDLNSTSTETRYNGVWVEAASIATGDVLVGMDGDFNVGIWQGGPALLNQRVCCVRGESALMSRYLRHVLPAPLAVTNDLTYFTTVKHLSSLDVERLTIPVPPPHLFEQVVNFLDEQTGRIDALIAEKERLCATLEDWREAELTRICFGTGQPLQATGNQWIPSLPAGWSAVRLKHLTMGIEQGWSPECEARLAADDEWGVLKAGAANGGVYRESEHKTLPRHFEPQPALEVRAGDVLVTRASGTAEYVGSFAYVYRTRERLMLSDKNFRVLFPSKPRLLPELLAWACNTHNMREQIGQYVSGAEGLAKNIGSGNLKEIWLPVPPLNQQPAMLDELRVRRLQSEDLQQHLSRHIERLREYRASLISAAVTGQLDISAFKKAA